MDVTTTNLEAALLDQKVAGAFRGREYAYVPVLSDAGWSVGIAERDEAGYTPITGGHSLHWERFEKADDFAASMNEHIGLTQDEADRIVSSSMRMRV